jgi:Aspartyl/Asparaginyl beta-hydroxylase/Sulfotransferase domain
MQFYRSFGNVPECDVNMATPPEEIRRQHEEACSLCCTQPSIGRVDHGEIPLAQKEHPTFLSPDGDEQNQHRGGQCQQSASADSAGVICISSRGQVDVTQLQSLVREGYNDPRDQEPEPELNQEQDGHSAGANDVANGDKPRRKAGMPITHTNAKLRSEVDPSNLWDDSNAAVNNVWVTRPSHDAWGIKKIVLIFCDDFLRDVFELPWWHLRQDIRQAIQPILETLMVQPDRIVRLLLAALPPGTTIPVHHDTGEWVRKTHRVHVPVIVTDPAKVIFRCGPSPETLDRIDCSPGHVFEMNNQAKHAVSNCGDDHRVHLILDYVDSDFQIARRLQLAPGERLLQTRRSIDRWSERGSRPTPTFLILGAQKAGTTSLYEYMVQHPLVVRARRRETHCLDWRWNEKAKTTQARREHCLKFFHAKELEHHPSCVTGDSTPSYLLDSKRVIPRLKLVFPHPLKFFVMLRNPVDRAYSHYQMVISPEGTPQQIQARGTEWRHFTFEQVIQEDMEKMHNCGLIPYFDIELGKVNMDEFVAFSGSKAENDAWDRFLFDVPLNTGSHSLLARGLYELQLRPWFKFFDRNRFMILKLEEFKREGVPRIMDLVWDHLGLPRYQVHDESAKNERSYAPMSEETRQYLQRFYAPHNRKMSEVLGILDWDTPIVRQTNTHA